MAANGISTLSSKEERQAAKLALAATDRAEDSRRAALDTTQLPNLYNGNDVDPDENPNTGGLVVGRPWTTLSAGLYLQPYSGYFGDNVNWFTSASTTGTPSTPSNFASTSISELTSYQYLGYFKAPVTGTYTFYIESDDASYLWVGDSANTGFTTANATASSPGLHPPLEGSGNIDLDAGEVYWFRAQVGNNLAGGTIIISYSAPSISKTTDFSGNVFYNPNTKGF